MRSTFSPCIPTASKAVPASAEWLHEIKYDGYRMIVHRDDDRVRLITKGGYDWSKRFPWIVKSALRNRQKQFVIDGEAVILGLDGIADFNALHSGKHNEEVQLYAFDILAIDGDDLRSLPLSLRETNLDRLLSRRRMEYSSRHSRPAKLVLICFAPPATWDSRVSYRSAGIGPIGLAGLSTGSR